MLSKCCDMSCKECTELVLKIIFVAVFTYGVMSAVCCMKSCSAGAGGFTCCKKAANVETVKQCGLDCQKACCSKK